MLLLLGPNILFSVSPVQHFLGTWAAGLYVVLAGCCALLLGSLTRSVAQLLGRPRWLRRLDGWAALVILFLCISATFFVLYPIAEARKVPGSGSDADDAIERAVRALLAGEYPYYVRTYAGNPITPMPGWLILALPFALLLGKAVYLNLFWLAVWLGVLGARAGSGPLAAALAGLLFVFCPVVPVFLFNGGDYFSSAAAVAVLAFVVDRPYARLPLPALIAVGALTGLALSSRFNMLLLLPILFATVVHRQGWRRGIAYAAVCTGTLAVVTVPFFVHDPSGFTPLHTYRVLGNNDALIPGFGVLVPLAVVVFSLWEARRTLRQGLRWRSPALTITIPVLAGTAAAVAREGTVGLIVLYYGILSTPFWALAAAQEQLGQTGEAPGRRVQPALGPTLGGAPLPHV